MEIKNQDQPKIMYILWGKCFKKETDWKMATTSRVIIVYYYITSSPSFGSTMKAPARPDLRMAPWWE